MNLSVVCTKCWNISWYRNSIYENVLKVLVTYSSLNFSLILWNFLNKNRSEPSQMNRFINLKVSCFRNFTGKKETVLLQKQFRKFIFLIFFFLLDILQMIYKNKWKASANMSNYEITLNLHKCFTKSVVYLQICNVCSIFQTSWQNNASK